VKSFNNHWGVPLTLARMPQQTARAIFEIGMSTPGEIAPRSDMVRPHCAIVTKIAGVHLAGLGSVAGVAEEKAGIFAGLEAGGVAVLPAEDDYLELLKTRAGEAVSDAEVLTFGTSPGADARVLDYAPDGHAATARMQPCWQVLARRGFLRQRRAKPCLALRRPPDGAKWRCWTCLAEVSLPSLMIVIMPTQPAWAQHWKRWLCVRLNAAWWHLVKWVSLVRRLTAFMPSLPGQLRLRAQRLRFWVVRACGLYPQFCLVRYTLCDEDLLLIKGSNASGMVQLGDALRQWSAGTNKQMMESGVENAAKGM